MTNITRAHLKNAVDQRNWDLLDKLLEIDSGSINDNSLYTDTWGEWWGLLVECTLRNHVDGVRVLLKHGAQRDLATWGDGMFSKPIELAKDKPEIQRLLLDPGRPLYKRQTDPAVPELNSKDAAVNRQGDVRDATGLVFQISDENDD